MDVSYLPLAGDGGLWDVLRKVRDPRRRAGMRYPGRALLASAVCAVLSGSRSFAAMAEWVADQPDVVRRTLGFNRTATPREKTFRIFLQRIDGERFAALIGDWFEGQLTKKAAQAIAVDGKTLRGSRQDQKSAVQLVSAVTHNDGVTIGQMEILGGNEIGAAYKLLSAMNIRGKIITLDALHTQPGTASLIVNVKDADYLMVVKGNQPTLLAEIENAPTALFSPGA